MMLAAFALSIIVFAGLDNSAAVRLNAGDALISVGLATTLYVIILKKTMNSNLAISLVLAYITSYCFLRSWLFYPTITAISRQMIPMYKSYFLRVPNIKIDENSIRTAVDFLLTYQSAIWGSMQILALFLGILLFNRTSMFKTYVSHIRLSFFFVYALIAAMALTLYPDTRIWGINLLGCLAVIYLIQGTAVLSFAWGGFFSRTRFLRTMLIMAVILNYPILILIAFIGILDVWFDFRKLSNMEEKHESNTN